MGILDSIKKSIEQNVNLDCPTISIGILSKNPKDVCIRLVPNANKTAYLDKGKTYQISFQVLVKDPSQKGAIRIIHDITDYLDQLTSEDIIITDPKYKFIRCEVYTMPNFVEKTEKNEYIYTALFYAEYEWKGA